MGCCHWNGLTVKNKPYCGSILHLKSHLEIPCRAAQCSGWKWCRDIEGGSPGRVGRTVHRAVCAALLSALPLCISIYSVQGSCFWQTDGGASKKGNFNFYFLRYDIRRSLESCLISLMKLFLFEDPIRFSLFGRNIPLKQKRSARTYPRIQK